LKKTAVDQEANSGSGTSQNNYFGKRFYVPVQQLN